MRKQTSIWKSLGLVTLLLCTTVIARGQVSKKSIQGNNADARIKRIVDGLLPAAIINGQPLPTMTLTDRMKYYHFPRVSIAFFDPAPVTCAHTHPLAALPT